MAVVRLKPGAITTRNQPQKGVIMAHCQSGRHVNCYSLRCNCKCHKAATK